MHHRPVDDNALDDIFAWREERTMSRNLVVHFKRLSYLVEPTPETLRLAGRKVKVTVQEWQDGRVEIRHGGSTLPYLPVDKEPHIRAGDIVENKRLGAVLTAIQATQVKRDEAHLASPRMTLAQKERLRATRQAVAAPGAAAAKPRRGRPPKVPRPSRITLAGVDPNGAVQAFFDQFAADQVERRRRQNRTTNDKKRVRELAATTARSATST